MSFFQPHIQNVCQVGPGAYVDVILDEFIIICLCNHFSIEGRSSVRHDANFTEWASGRLFRRDGR